MDSTFSDKIACTIVGFISSLMIGPDQLVLHCRRRSGTRGCCLGALQRQNSGPGLLNSPREQ